MFHLFGCEALTQDGSYRHRPTQALPRLPYFTAPSLVLGGELPRAGVQLHPHRGVQPVPHHARPHRGPWAGSVSKEFPASMERKVSDSGLVIMIRICFSVVFFHTQVSTPAYPNHMATPQGKTKGVLAILPPERHLAVFTQEIM